MADAGGAFSGFDGAALAVNGGVKVKGIELVSATVNPASVASKGTGATSVTVSGVAVGDVVIAIPPSTLDDGVVYSAKVTAADTVKLELSNNTAGAIDVASATWKFLVLDIT